MSSLNPRASSKSLSIDMRQTQRDRRQIKTELAGLFDKWNKMTDDELMAEAKKRFPIIAGPPIRGELLKFLVMDHLDKID
jgi:hypothetical protein